MDFFLGIILGIVGYSIYITILENRKNAKAPKRGRPVKQTTDVEGKK